LRLLFWGKSLYHYQQNPLVINKTADFHRFLAAQIKIHINLLNNL